MPAQETAFRRQSAVLWRAVGKDRHNNVLIRPPEEIRVRWNNDPSSMLDATNTVVRIDASVEVAIDFPLYSIMWLGCLCDWYGTGSGGFDADLMQVILVRKTPDIKGRNYYRRCGLLRYGGRLPGYA